MKKYGMDSHKKYPPGDIRRFTDLGKALDDRSQLEKWVDKKILDCYYGKTRFKFIPFYFEMFGYRLCIYAMNMDWESTRIKIEDVNDSYRIVKVIKEGTYLGV